jgi:hypothetical protein
MICGYVGQLENFSCKFDLGFLGLLGVEILEGFLVPKDVGFSGFVKSERERLRIKEK